MREVARVLGLILALFLLGKSWDNIFGPDPEVSALQVAKERNFE